MLQPPICLHVTLKSWEGLRTGLKKCNANVVCYVIWDFFAGVQVNISPTVCDVGIQCDLIANLFSSTPLHDVASESELSDIEEHNVSNTSTYMPSSSP